MTSPEQDEDANTPHTVRELEAERDALLAEVARLTQQTAGDDLAVVAVRRKLDAAHAEADRLRTENTTLIGEVQRLEQALDAIHAKDVRDRGHR